MIATTRSAECDAGGTPLMLAFDLGSTLDAHDPEQLAVGDQGRHDLAFQMRQPRERNLPLQVTLTGLLDRRSDRPREHHVARHAGGTNDRAPLRRDAEHPVAEPDFRANAGRIVTMARDRIEALARFVRDHDERARVPEQRGQTRERGLNLKLTQVMSNLVGVSGRAVLQALIAGETDPERLGDLTRGRLKATRADLVDALTSALTTSNNGTNTSSPSASFSASATLASPWRSRPHDQAGYPNGFTLGLSGVGSRDGFLVSPLPPRGYERGTDAGGQNKQDDSEEVEVEVLPHQCL